MCCVDSSNFDLQSDTSHCSAVKLVSGAAAVAAASELPIADLRPRRSLLHYPRTRTPFSPTPPPHPLQLAVLQVVADERREQQRRAALARHEGAEGVVEEMELRRQRHA